LEDAEMRALRWSILFAAFFGVSFAQQVVVGLRDYLELLKTSPGNDIPQRIDWLTRNGITLSTQGLQDLNAAASASMSAYQSPTKTPEQRAQEMYDQQIGIKRDASGKVIGRNWLKMLLGVTAETARGASEKAYVPPMERYREQALREYGAQTGYEYVGQGGGHWIRDNSGGKIITLEDGSIWQINTLDQIDTALWLPITDITVAKASSPTGDYKYVLFDKQEGEKALAKYLGHE
jgi:hypothetical protein